MTNKSYRDLNAPDLVKKWKSIVNDHVMMGRDSAFMKELLEKATPVQILYGMYQYHKVSITVPQFIKSMMVWYEEDEILAEIELARYVTNYTPPEYYTYIELENEESSFAFQKSFAARQKLREWAEGILA